MESLRLSNHHDGNSIADLEDLLVSNIFARLPHASDSFSSTKKNNRTRSTKRSCLFSSAGDFPVTFFLFLANEIESHFVVSVPTDQMVITLSIA